MEAHFWRKYSPFFSPPLSLGRKKRVLQYREEKGKTWEQKQKSFGASPLPSLSFLKGPYLEGGRSLFRKKEKYFLFFWGQGGRAGVETPPRLFFLFSKIEFVEVRKFSPGSCQIWQKKIPPVGKARKWRILISRIGGTSLFFFKKNFLLFYFQIRSPPRQPPHGPHPVAEPVEPEDEPGRGRGRPGGGPGAPGGLLGGRRGASPPRGRVEPAGHGAVKQEQRKWVSQIR